MIGYASISSIANAQTAPIQCPGAATETLPQGSDCLPVQPAPVPSPTTDAPVAVGPGTLPASAMTMITLGNAGLLQSMFSLERQGLAQTRVGEARAALGYASLSGVRTGYLNRDRALVLPVGVIKNIPIAGDGALFVRGAVTTSLGDGDRTLQWNDGYVLRSDVQLLYAPSPGTMLGVGAIYQSVKVDNHYTSADIVGFSNRDAWGLRADAAKVISPNWGATARIQFTTGDNHIGIPLFEYLHVTRSDEYYGQTEITGRFSHRDAKWIPDGIALYPIIGVNYYYGHFQRTPDSYGFVYGSAIDKAERYGTVWADLRVEKTPDFTRKPQVLPYASVGIERELKNNLDSLISESTYGHGSAGLAILVGNHRIDVAYNDHFGTRGRRRIRDLVISMAFGF